MDGQGTLKITKPVPGAQAGEVLIPLEVSASLLAVYLFFVVLDTMTLSDSGGYEKDSLSSRIRRREPLEGRRKLTHLSRKLNLNNFIHFYAAFS